MTFSNPSSSCTEILVWGGSIVTFLELIERLKIEYSHKAAVLSNLERPAASTDTCIKVTVVTL